MALLFWLIKMGGDSSLSSPSFLGAAHPPVVLLSLPSRQLGKLHPPGASARVDRGVVAMGSQPFSVAANEGAGARGSDKD